MVASALIAHAGHPSEWLPFVAPIVLVALAWFVIRVRESAGPEGAEQDGENAEGVAQARAGARRLPAPMSRRGK
jgi:hypothetical protein